MTITLPPDLERSVRRHLESGRYRTTEDVLRAALLQLDEMDLESLKLSIDDEAHGRLIALDTAVAAVRERLNIGSLP